MIFVVVKICVWDLLKQVYPYHSCLKNEARWKLYQTHEQVFVFLCYCFIISILAFLAMFGNVIANAASKCISTLCICNVSIKFINLMLRGNISMFSKCRYSVDAQKNHKKIMKAFVG